MFEEELAMFFGKPTPKRKRKNRLEEASEFCTNAAAALTTLAVLLHVGSRIFEK